jgi:uncharacterized protein
MITFKQARKWYAANDPVHGFDHVLRVYALAERLAIAEGADVEIVRAATLLHDAQPETVTKKQNNEERADHHLTSADFAGELLAGEGWAEERVAAVQHCIRSHRFRDELEQPQSLEAMVLFDADKLDAIGATGVGRAIAYAARAGMPIYAQPSQRFLETGELEEGEAHSAYHEYAFKLHKLEGRLYTASGRTLGRERQGYLDEFFERLAAESSGKI